MKLLLMLLSCAGSKPREPDPSEAPLDSTESTPSDSDLPTTPCDPDTESTSDTADTGVASTTLPLQWVTADAGNEVSCGLVSDGTVRCWGRDYCTDRAPDPAEQFTQISVGIWGACGIRLDGTVGCWCCDHPFVDDGDDICSDAPPGVFGRVEVGRTHACAQDAAGILTCWGDLDLYGRFGEQPVGPVLDFALEENMAAAVLADGSFQGWGIGDEWGPVTPAGPLAQVEVGNLHVCTLDVAGNGECWGFHSEGSPYPQPPPGTFVSIESYQVKTCVIDAAGLATCWWGEDDEPADVWPIPMPVVPYAQIGLGEPDGCGVSVTGEAYCWGGQIWVGPWLYPPDLNP